METKLFFHDEKSVLPLQSTNAVCPRISSDNAGTSRFDFRSIIFSFSLKSIINNNISFFLCYLLKKISVCCNGKMFLILSLAQPAGGAMGLHFQPPRDGAMHIRCLSWFSPFNLVESFLSPKISLEPLIYLIFSFPFFFWSAWSSLSLFFFKIGAKDKINWGSLLAGYHPRWLNGD